MEAHPQEEVSQSDPEEADLVVEDSRLVGLEVAVVAVAVVHHLHWEGHTPDLLLVRMMTHSTVNQTSRRTRIISRSKIGRTGSGAYVTYCTPKGWSKC